VSEPRIEAGRVGRPHGLDGSFYVTGVRPRLLREGTSVWLDGECMRIVAKRGVEERPIVRLEGVEDRTAAQALRGRTLAVERSQAPALGEDEWWAEDLQGCAVLDGERAVGVVRRLLELPSCEALEVIRGPARGPARAARDAEEEGDTEPRDSRPRQDQPLLVPMVRDAIRSVDMAARTIDVDMSFVEGG
jgi:16S rRNA processing protein RimM